jgi:hypothetical protein
MTAGATSSIKPKQEILEIIRIIQHLSLIDARILGSSSPDPAPLSTPDVAKQALIGFAVRMRDSLLSVPDLSGL